MRQNMHPPKCAIFLLTRQYAGFFLTRQTCENIGLSMTHWYQMYIGNVTKHVRSFSRVTVYIKLPYAVDIQTGLSLLLLTRHHVGMLLGESMFRGGGVCGGGRVIFFWPRDNWPGVNFPKIFQFPRGYWNISSHFNSHVGCQISTFLTSVSWYTYFLHSFMFWMPTICFVSPPPPMCPSFHQIKATISFSLILSPVPSSSLFVTPKLILLP